MRWAFVTFIVAAVSIAVSGVKSSGLVLPVDTSARPAIFARLQALEPRLRLLANRTPGLVAISVADANGLDAIDINGDENLPAASVIKLPVMVEVMRQAALGKFTLDREVTLYPQDRDCGYGSLCERAAGLRFSVRNLTRIMIDNSDNTATNMLIRLVGRQNINETMAGLGLSQTWVGDSIHAGESSIRSLRTSSNDMMRLLAMIAGRRLVSEHASDVMLGFLAAQLHNSYLPKPLPRGTVVAHKTGTLHDTLNDVGIVDLEGSPYIICVLTTHLEDLDDGARFIRKASRAVYETMLAAQADETAAATPEPSPSEAVPLPNPSETLEGPQQP
jgi:beta-lactamase class A